MIKFVNVLTVLFLAISYSATNIAAPQNLLDYEGDVQDGTTPNAADPSDIPRKLYETRVSTPTLAASTSAPSQPRNGGLKIFKTKSGIIDSDDFNDGVLHAKWADMQHEEIKPKEKNGWLVVKGVPSPDASTGWHAGAMTKREYWVVNKDVVMAVKYRVPNWSFECSRESGEFSEYEVHLCNPIPDNNRSILITRLCDNSMTRNRFAGLTEEQLDIDQIRNEGVVMSVSYNDGKATGYTEDSNGVVHESAREVAVDLEDHKRMELKVRYTSTGKELNLMVDWAVLYPQPLDVPARIRIPGLAATKIEVKIGDWSGVYPVSDGVATFKLPATRIYPSAATVTVFKGENPLGILKIQRKNDLDGLYPGDTWKIAKK